MTSVPNPALNAGLAALKQGDYAIAIAHFEQVCETESDEFLVSRAAQGLVLAYGRRGDLENAIAHCQNLTQHPNPKLRQWAASTLVKLETIASKTPPNNPKDTTGFVAFAQAPKQQGKLGVSHTRPAEERHSTPTRSPAEFTPEKALPLSPDLPASTPVPTPEQQWRNSRRAQKWSPLKPLPLARFWLVQIASAIALFWVLSLLIQFLLRTTNTLLVWLPFVGAIPHFYRNPTPALLVLLAILLVLSPWLLDGLLKRFHGLEPLALSQLASRSPEAAKVMQRLCRQRRLPLPTLGILPTDAPVALTYGNLPQTARVVVSEGLLAQLADDEIATIYAGQLGQIVHRDFILMSLGVLLLQLPYTLYWQIAQWGRLPASIDRKLPAYRRFLPPLLQGIAGVIAALGYGIYWLLRLPLLWFSRSRVYHSDRLAVETTGNPNAQIRALLKIALGITADIQNTGKTSGLLEGFDLLLPVGYKQALPLSSCSAQTPLEALLTWDCVNPYRDWLSISASHPLLGDRVALLARYAQFWKLEPELDLPSPTPPIRDNAAQFAKLRNSPQAFPLLQAALLLGLVLGCLLRLSFWMIGRISEGLGIWQLIWLYNAGPFLNACILIAFSLSLFLGINRYFPDLKPTTVQIEPNLGELFAQPTTLPPDRQPVQLTGKLLGRRGLFNGLGQDLILQTSTGCVKLYFCSCLGPFGNLLPHSLHPSAWVGQHVTVTGWFRRGATPWIDLETISTSGGKLSRAYYPIWVTILGLVAACWGAYLVWQA